MQEKNHYTDNKTSDVLEEKKLPGAENENSPAGNNFKPVDVKEINGKDAIALEDKVEKEVKESFKDEDVPVEPVLGNDGIEVGGEG